MQNDFVEYSWRNHMPGLGPVDLTIAALTGIVLSVSVVCGPPGGERTKSVDHISQSVATAPIESGGLDDCGRLASGASAPRSI